MSPDSCSIFRNTIAERVRNKSTLITGASGFVGRALVREALFLNDTFGTDIRLTLVVRNESSIQDLLAENRTEIEIVISQVGSRIELRDEIDYVFHCATPASASLNVNSPLQMFQTNIDAMNWLLTSLKVLSCTPTVVFTSSGAVYGHQPENLSHIPENYVGAPNVLDSKSAYAEGKRVSEFLLSQAGFRNEVIPVVARLFAFSGIGLPLDRHFAIGNFIFDALNNEKILVRGTGKAIRSYLDSSDMALWLWAAATKPAVGQPLHIGSEFSVQIADVAQLVAQRSKTVLDKEIEVEILGQTSSIDGVDHYVPSTKLTREILGADQWTTLEGSIDQMLLANRRNY